MVNFRRNRSSAVDSTPAKGTPSSGDKRKGGVVGGVSLFGKRKQWAAAAAAAQQQQQQQAANSSISSSRQDHSTNNGKSRKYGTSGNREKTHHHRHQHRERQRPSHQESPGSTSVGFTQGSAPDAWTPPMSAEEEVEEEIEEDEKRRRRRHHHRRYHHERAMARNDDNHHQDEGDAGKFAVPSVAVVPMKRAATTPEQSSYNAGIQMIRSSSNNSASVANQQLQQNVFGSPNQSPVPRRYNEEGTVVSDLTTPVPQPNRPPQEPPPIFARFVKEEQERVRRRELERERQRQMQQFDDAATAHITRPRIVSDTPKSIVSSLLGLVDITCVNPSVHGSENDPVGGAQNFKRNLSFTPEWGVAPSFDATTDGDRTSLSFGDMLWGGGGGGDSSLADTRESEGTSGYLTDWFNRGGNNGGNEHGGNGNGGVGANGMGHDDTDSNRSVITPPTKSSTILSPPGPHPQQQRHHHHHNNQQQHTTHQRHHTRKNPPVMETAQSVAPSATFTQHYNYIELGKLTGAENDTVSFENAIEDNTTIDTKTVIDHTNTDYTNSNERIMRTTNTHGPQFGKKAGLPPAQHQHRGGATIISTGDAIEVPTPPRTQQQQQIQQEERSTTGHNHERTNVIADVVLDAEQQQQLSPSIVPKKSIKMNLPPVEPVIEPDFEPPTVTPSGNPTTTTKPGRKGLLSTLRKLGGGGNKNDKSSSSNHRNEAQQRQQQQHHHQQEQEPQQHATIAVTDRTENARSRTATPVEPFIPTVQGNPDDGEQETDEQVQVPTVCETDDRSKGKAGQEQSNENFELILDELRYGDKMLDGNKEHPGAKQSNKKAGRRGNRVFQFLGGKKEEAAAGGSSQKQEKSVTPVSEGNTGTWVDNCSRPAAAYAINTSNENYKPTHEGENLPDRWSVERTDADENANPDHADHALDEGMGVEPPGVQPWDPQPQQSPLPKTKITLPPKAPVIEPEADSDTEENNGTSNKVKQGPALPIKLLRKASRKIGKKEQHGGSVDQDKNSKTSKSPTLVEEYTSFGIENDSSRQSQDDVSLNTIGRPGLQSVSNDDLQAVEEATIATKSVDIRRARSDTMAFNRKLAGIHDTHSVAEPFHQKPSNKMSSDASYESQEETTPELSDGRRATPASLLAESLKTAQQEKNTSRVRHKTSALQEDEQTVLKQPEDSPKTKDASRQTSKALWKAAVDPKSGRIYYYHRVTRKSTWSKPPDSELYHGRGAINTGQPANSHESRDPAEPTSAAGILALMKKSTRKNDPVVWGKKEEIARLLAGMAPPDGTSVEKLISHYDGREDELLVQLRSLTDSRPFDEPVGSGSSNKKDETEDKSINVRSRASARTGTSLLSFRSKISEETEPIKNTARGRIQVDETIEETESQATSISSKRDEVPLNDGGPYTSDEVEHDEHVAPDIATVPRARELMVEEYSTERFKAETYDVTNPLARKLMAYQSNMKPLVGESESSEHSQSESAGPNDSISALSETDNEFNDRRAAIMAARRRALDEAIAREDWDLAAVLSDSLKSLNVEQPRMQTERREWTQSELDRFISENDWDAVADYIAHVRSQDKELEHPPERPPLSPMSRVRSLTKPRRRKSSSRSSSSRPHNDTHSDSSGSSPRKRFGARSQLQHDDLHSVSSWESSYSSYSEDFSSAFTETEEDDMSASFGRLPNRRKEYSRGGG